MSNIIREMQIKAIVRCNLIPIGMVTIKKRENECEECFLGEMRTLCALLVEMSSDRVMENSRVSGVCTPLFITILFTTAKLWKQFKCPSVDERINLKCLAFKREEILQLGDMDEF